MTSIFVLMSYLALGYSISIRTSWTSRSGGDVYSDSASVDYVASPMAPSEPRPDLVSSGKIIKQVSFKIYTTDSTVRDLANRKINLEKFVERVKSKLERSINNTLEAKRKNLALQLESSISLVPPTGVNLDFCFPNVVDIMEILVKGYKKNPNESSIFILNCPPKKYTDIFRQAGVNVPRFNLNLFPTCSANTLIFAEAEINRFSISLSTAIMSMIGVYSKNPLYYEINGEGDLGITQNIKFAQDVITAIEDNTCYASH